MMHRYDHPIRKVWDIASQYRRWFLIEHACLNVQGYDIPLPKELKEDVFPDDWIHQIQQKEIRTKHDVAAFVDWMEEYLAPANEKASRHVHYGLTSSDIVDTAFSLAIRSTNDLLTQESSAVQTTLKVLADDHDTTSIVGRTHGQAAELISLGSKFRAYGRALAQYTPCPMYYGRLSGSVGDNKHLSVAQEALALLKLNLRPSPINDGQIIHRAYYATMMNSWAVLASCIAKIATDIRLLSHDGVSEVAEPFDDDQIGSSSMPHKRNPIQSENLCGLARVIRGYQTTAMQDIELWNERDISHSSAERIIFPDASVTLGFMLVRLNNILQNLTIDVRQLDKNIRRNTTVLDSQSQMLDKIDKGSSRKAAHKKGRK